jgi:hypothetical protein
MATPHHHPRPTPANVGQTGPSSGGQSSNSSPLHLLPSKAAEVLGSSNQRASSFRPNLSTVNVKQLRNISQPSRTPHKESAYGLPDKQQDIRDPFQPSRPPHAEFTYGLPEVARPDYSFRLQQHRCIPNTQRPSTAQTPKARTHTIPRRPLPSSSSISPFRRTEYGVLSGSHYQPLSRNEGKPASIQGLTADRGGLRSQEPVETKRSIDSVSTAVRNGLHKMPKAAPPALSLGSKTDNKSQPPLSPSALSPVTPHTPRSPHQQTSRPLEPVEVNSEQPPGSPITAIPQFPPSPTISASKHGRDASKSLFSNLKASRSTNRLNGADQNAKASSKPDLTSRASSKDRNMYNSSRGHDSTPELQNFTSPERNYGTCEFPICNCNAFR